MARILVANDDSLGAELLALTLTAEGHEVIPAVNGFDAYESAVHDDPDLVILDPVMPIYSGYDICEMLRNDPAIPKELPVVFMTTGNEDRRRIERVGATDTISKNYAAVELRDLLVKHLGTKAVA
ncbi:MAG: response regulator [Candidatus Hydrogenedentes bacterium]|nr:response regulator [Candidatus Hydrogenedentota bacterium]